MGEASARRVHHFEEVQSAKGQGIILVWHSAYRPSVQSKGGAHLGFNGIPSRLHVDLSRQGQHEGPVVCPAILARLC